ncbi:MAG TPA: PAS-domain containing protein, partial [Stellaceae bacterium]|nr:PAS-domain containing protein [Stellaceae bacterium]
MTVWLGMAGALGLLPKPAYAAESAAATLLPYILGATLVALAATAAVAIFRLRHRLQRLAAERDETLAALAENRAVLGATPAALFRWNCRDGSEIFTSGPLSLLGDAGPARFADLLARVAAKDRAALEAAVAQLRDDGTAFQLNLALVDGGFTLDATGRRARRGDGTALSDLVWLADGSRSAEAIAARDQNAQESRRLRAILDALPLPVWQRGPDLELLDCNRAYGAAVDTTWSKALAEQREVAAGVVGENGRAIASRARDTLVTQSESHHIVIAGSRRLMEFTEAPLDGTDDFVGYARDFTDVENTQSELARHIAAHADVLENVAVAIAIYGPDNRLTFFNTAFATLWRLEEDWLVTEPSLDELLERLRERRRLPEYADFRAFKRQQLGMFTSLIEPQEELLHLPDERTLRLVVSPHPFGGLTFVYEDVTDKLALERSY